MENDTQTPQSEGATSGHSVTIYSTPTCHFCHQVKEFLKENNVAFTDYDVAEDATKREEMLNKTGQMGVPVIDIDGEIIIGFNEPKLRELLDIA